MHRRHFLQHAGCAMCAIGAEPLLRRASSATAAEAYARLDARALLNLADMAIDLAKHAGASYADVRIGRSEQEFIRARERRLDELGSAHSVGIGVRVLLDGSWGFAGSERVSEDEIIISVALAAENARASRLIQATPIVLESVTAYHDDWRMPMQVDPFAVSPQQKASMLIAINEAALTAGADYCSSLLGFVREEKLFCQQHRQPHHAGTRAQLALFRGHRRGSAIRPLRYAFDAGGAPRLGLGVHR
jgi:TldD protein